MAEHTPTPWTLATNDTTLIVTEALDNNGDCFVVADVLNGGMPSKEACVANAAFIVKACNSHDALVEVLDAAIHVINITRSPGSYTAENVLEDAERTFDKAVDALRALALSEQDRERGSHE